MKKSIVRTSLALAVAGVLGTSVVAYAAEAPQVQPVPVVKEAVQTAPVVKQEATAPPNFSGAVAFVDDIEITGVILFILYVLSWHAIREATEDFIRNGRGKGCNFKSRDAFMTLRTQ